MTADISSLVVILDGLPGFPRSVLSLHYEIVERTNKRYLAVMTGTEEDPEGFILSKNV
jgi:hypothetical protein